MKILSASLLALALAGCASVSRPQVGIISHPVATHKVEAAPSAIATPLKAPRWYDRFRQKNGRFFH